MRRKSAIIFWIISISLVLFLAGSPSLFGAMAGNESDTAFDEGDTTTTESLIMGISGSGKLCVHKGLKMFSAEWICSNN